MRVVLEIAVPGEILSRYYPNGKLGGLTLDGTAPGTVGKTVDLVIRVALPKVEFKIRGQLSWARHKGSRGLKECFGIDFFSDDESSQRLIAFAQHELHLSALRAEARLSTELSVSITHKGLVRREVLLDLSSGGAFVRSETPLAVGEKTVLQLRPPGALTSLSFDARVTWVRATGPAAGMGLMFVGEDPKLRARLDKLLASLSRE